MFDFIEDMIRRSMDGGSEVWIYSQTSGNLWHPDGRLIHVGYSGCGKGKNNPAYQHVKNEGPIPRGEYVIGKPYDSKKIGPLAIPLSPIDHDCLGRDYFRFHGDSLSDPGNASKGCIICPKKIRRHIADFVGRRLKVIE